MSTDSIAPIDLLIRSTSTLLHMVKHQATVSSTPAGSQSNLSSKLDRIALLFVTKNKADVVAVTTTISKDAVTVIAAVDSEAAAPESTANNEVTAPQAGVGDEAMDDEAPDDEATDDAVTTPKKDVLVITENPAYPLRGLYVTSLCPSQHTANVLRS